MNIFGESLDLQAAGLLHESIDPEQVSEEVIQRYDGLWHELTYEQQLEPGRPARHGEAHPPAQRTRLRRGRGVHGRGGRAARYVIRPKVVDAGHHTRRLMRLTGLDAEENQARQLLNDLDAYRAESDLTDEQQAAHRWLTEVFEPVVRAVPAELRGKLEPTGAVRAGDQPPLAAVRARPAGTWGWPRRSSRSSPTCWCTAPTSRPCSASLPKPGLGLAP